MLQMQHAQAQRLPTKQILIVEDNPLNMKLLHDVLVAHGYATITTGEGKAALSLARQHWPDLVLMDLQLPDISGLDAVAELKRDERTRSIPVVAVTAFALVDDERKALAGGCDGYVSKPIGLRSFLDLVEKFIGTA
jgi:two-component system, cell cycle response regulator DivK